MTRVPANCPAPVRALGARRPGSVDEPAAAPASTAQPQIIDDTDAQPVRPPATMRALGNAVQQLVQHHQQLQQHQLQSAARAQSMRVNGQAGAGTLRSLTHGLANAGSPMSPSMLGTAPPAAAGAFNPLAQSALGGAANGSAFGGGGLSDLLGQLGNLAGLGGFGALGGGADLAGGSGFFEDRVMGLMIEVVAKMQKEVERRLNALQGAAAMGGMISAAGGKDPMAESRNIEFEKIKFEMQKLSQMQQAMSNVLNTMDELAKSAIRHIKAG